MLDIFGEAGTIFGVGLLGGIALGLAARLGRFCTLGMIEDAHFGQDLTRTWMWLSALGVAIAANFLADGAGLLDLSATFFLVNTFSLAGAVVGGLIFGYGMALAGNCGFGMLARLGGGDLRALVIALVMGVTAFATISGVLSTARVALFPVALAAEPAGWLHLLGAGMDISPVPIGAGLGLLLFALAARHLIRAGRLMSLLWGSVAGLAVFRAFSGRIGSPIRALKCGTSPPTALRNLWGRPCITLCSPLHSAPVSGSAQSWVSFLAEPLAAF